jgi:hypothetical protein
MRKTFSLMILALAALALPLAAQEGSLRFEKTVSWQTGKLIPLDAKVGPVRVAKVSFENAGKGGGGGAGAIVGRLRGGGGPSDTETTLRASFDGENPAEEEWVVTYTLEFLDRDGRLIDRASKSTGYEGEAKVYELDHPILDYVVPMISRVRIKLEARLD